MADFQYRPLDSRSPCFRLLKLLKGDTIEIECEILHNSISEHGAIPYEALSYAWGSTELVVCIKVNEKRLWITENLHSALQCLRHRNHDRVLWIDAICINQFDLEERSQQVQKMGMIFSSAQRVIFWLGRPTAEAALLLDFLAESERQTRSEPSTYEGDTVNSIPLNNALSGMQPTSKIQDHSLVCQQRRRERSGLKFLLQRPWFGRVWILQEVANAQSAIVCSGTFSISAHTFALAPSLLDLNTDIRVQSILEIMPGPYRAKSWWSQEGARDLFNLLVKFRDSQATDVRDTIFALLGMSSESSHHHLLRADYTKSLEEVLHDAIRYWSHSSTILVGQVLDFLTGFKNIHVTYLILPEKTKAEREGTRRQRAPNSFAITGIEVAGAIRDAGLFLLEQHREEALGDMDTYHTELKKLQSNISRVNSGKILHVVLWKSNEPNIQFLIVKEVLEALLLLGEYDCRRTFNLVLHKCTDNRQSLLENSLCAAVTRRWWSIVEFLLNEGAEFNDQGGNALYMAADQGLEKVVTMLLDRGVDIDAEGGEYGTAIHAASEKGHEEVVKLLLDRGANVDAEGGEYGFALWAAMANGHETILRMLLDAGADFSAKTKYDKSIIYELVGGMSLQAASHSGHEKLVQLLLYWGANINAEGGYYGTALQAASSSGHEKIVQFLLDQGADVNAKGDQYGSALGAALLHGRGSVVQILLDRGADVHAQGGKHSDALQAAFESGQYVKEIARRGGITWDYMTQRKDLHRFERITSKSVRFRASKGYDHGWIYLNRNDFEPDHRELSTSGT